MHVNVYLYFWMFPAIMPSPILTLLVFVCSKRAGVVIHSFTIRSLPSHERKSFQFGIGWSSSTQAVRLDPTGSQMSSDCNVQDKPEIYSTTFSLVQRLPCLNLLLLLEMISTTSAYNRAIKKQPGCLGYIKGWKNCPVIWGLYGIIINYSNDPSMIFGYPSMPWK